MVSDFHWKLMIAGTVGGACALFTSILVFAVLACRHQRKLKKKRAAAAAAAAAASAHLSPGRFLTQGSPHLNERLDGSISAADLPLPIPPDSNYIRTPWPVGHFWMGQNSVNHDSGCDDLSERTDSALFLQRSFSPLPRNVNSLAPGVVPGDTFPAMNQFDSAWSRSFDLSSPAKPYNGLRSSNIATRNSANPVGLLPNEPSGDDVWKSRVSSSSSNNVWPSCQPKPRGSDCGLQLMELSHPAGNNCPNSGLKSQYSGYQASVPSSSDNDDSDPIWVRRTSNSPDGTLTQSMINCNHSDSNAAWKTHGLNHSIPGRLTRDISVLNAVSPSLPSSRTIPENAVHQKLSSSGYSAVKNKRSDYTNSWRTNGIIGHVIDNRQTNTNLSSR